MKYPKTIIIDGISGSGKGEVAKLLSKKFNCPIIHGDFLMFKAVTDLQDEMEAFFGKRPGKKDGLSYLIPFFQKSTIEKERALPQLTRDNVEKQLEWILENLDWQIKNYDSYMMNVFGERMYNSKANSSRIIFEWYTSNKFKYAWSNATVRIMLKPNIEKRSKFMLERAKIQGFPKDISFPEVRRQAIEPLLKDASEVNYFVPNEFDNSLECAVDFIYRDIKEKDLF
jgi:hypothetical protein